MSSIAFPTVGCAQLKFDPATVAECFKAAERDSGAALTVCCLYHWTATCFYHILNWNSLSLLWIFINLFTLPWHFTPLLMLCIFRYTLCHLKNCYSKSFSHILVSIFSRKFSKRYCFITHISTVQYDNSLFRNMVYG